MSLYLERDVEGTGPEHRWGRWRVLDSDDDALVGFVAEEREWLGDTYGPSRYYVAHNPSGEAYGSLWRAEDLPSPTDALGALADHLARAGG